ncbi:hypothetical protein HY408_00580 [Candidatus Gottesmanbacteria bacterium]|nr:hypothetical protein [Candidatus Gottesmanbacteria bacterium]
MDDIKKKYNSLIIRISILIILVVFNGILLYFVSSKISTLGLLEKEYFLVLQTEQFNALASGIIDSYKEEIIAVSSAFPNETTMPIFIEQFEGEIGKYADEFKLKFNALTPLKEKENLFLPLTITMKTDFTRFTDFLETTEKLRYFIHITSIDMKTPGSFDGGIEVTLGFKLYVQNPYAAK